MAEIVSAVQHGGVCGAARRKQGSRVGQGLRERVLPQHARSGDRAQHPLRRGPETCRFGVDMFNAPNSAIITGRNTTMKLRQPDGSDDHHEPAVRCVPGRYIPSRSRPSKAGFGVATDYQAPRKLQCSSASRSNLRRGPACRLPAGAGLRESLTYDPNTRPVPRLNRLLVVAGCRRDSISACAEAGSQPASPATTGRPTSAMLAAHTTRP